MVNLKDFALNMIANSPNVRQNPQMQEFISVIQNGDNARGEQIANNLCSTYGVSREQALSNAKRFFGI